MQARISAQSELGFKLALRAAATQLILKCWNTPPLSSGFRTPGNVSRGLSASPSACLLPALPFLLVVVIHSPCAFTHSHKSSPCVSKPSCLAGLPCPPLESPLYHLRHARCLLFRGLTITSFLQHLTTSACKHFVTISDISIYLLQEAVQGILILQRKAIFLQPKEELWFLIRLESQQVHHPISERPLGDGTVALLDGAGKVDRCWAYPRGNSVGNPWCRPTHLNGLSYGLGKLGERRENTEAWAFCCYSFQAK